MAKGPSAPARARGAFVLVAVLAGLTPGCPNECQALADVICQCEPELSQREACRVEVETQQQRLAEPPTVEQRAACAAALETCTCESLDRNETEQCGFAREPEATP